MSATSYIAPQPGSEGEDATYFCTRKMVETQTPRPREYSSIADAAAEFDLTGEDDPADMPDEYPALDPALDPDLDSALTPEEQAAPSPGPKRTNAADLLAGLSPDELAELDKMEAAESAEPRFRENADVQSHIVGLLAGDSEWTARHRNIVKPTYFTSETDRTIAGAVLEYHGQYGVCPPQDVLRNLVGHRISDKPADAQERYLRQVDAIFSFYAPNPVTRGYVEDVVGDFAAGAEFARAVRDALDGYKKTNKLDKAAFAQKWDHIQRIGSAQGGKRALLISDLDTLPPVEWLVQDHFPVGGFVCAYGPFGAGKSFAALDMALCVATGKPYLGRYSVKQVPVCYVAAEGHSGIKKRIRAWLKHHGLDAPKNFVLLPETFDLVGDADAPAEIATLAKSKLGEDPKVIWLDTTARMFGGGDENSTKDMNQYVANVAALGRLCGAAVVNVHHTGKDFTKGARGAVSLGAACDSMFEISGSPADGVNVRCIKQKDAAPFKPYVLRSEPIHLDGDPDGSIVLEYAGQQAEETAKANSEQFSDEEFQLSIHLPELDAKDVTPQAAVTSAKLEEKLTWTQPKVSRVLTRLVGKGKAQRKRAGSANTPWLYWRERVLQ